MKQAEEEGHGRRREQTRRREGAILAESDWGGSNARKVEQLLAECGAGLMYEHRRGRTRGTRSRKKGE